MRKPAIVAAVVTLVVTSLGPVTPAQETGPAPQGAGGRGGAAAPVRMGGAGAADPANATADYSPKPAVQPLTPDEQLKHFILPPGYRLELVLSDPLVLSPAAMAFDGNGRLYIAEMRTFMRDADGTGQLEPKSRISMHESSKGDGVYDKHTVFADNLVLPRMLLPLDRGILINETRSDDVVRLTDTNGDGRADTREVFFTGIGTNRDGNVQHEQSGLVWGLDNWIYSTYNSFRFRWTPGGIVREPSGPPSAEWGLTMDDDGKMWFVNSGGERGPVNFQVPIVYGAFNTPDQFEPGFDVVWPAPGIGDMQGGLPRVRLPINNLNHFTSTNGQEIVRTDKYPDMQGDLLFCDPVGRLVRRAKVVTSDGLTQLKNAYPGSEFIVSTDPLFRPLNIKQGPDGALYILDMYNGIIQDANWTGRGTYLRAKIEQYQLDRVTNHGRVWRLRFDGVALDRTAPRMNNASPAQLVAHLTHVNGWWRDTAQRLLVLKQDKSVVPALRRMARASGSLVGRFHALWTLEGLGALDAAFVREIFKDVAPRMRVQAIRASETLYKAGDRTLAEDYRAMALDANPNVAIQAMLTLNLFKAPDVAGVIRSAQTANTTRGVKTIGDLLLNPPAAGRGGRGGAVPAAQQQVMEKGRAIYTELCFSCHGDDGRGQPLAGAPPGTLMAPSLAGSPRVNGHRDYVINAVLHGLTGPIGGMAYSQVMVPMGAQNDEWVASIASYVRTSFGNSAGFVAAADVARVRAATSARKTPWTQPDLEAVLPRLLVPQPTWKASASHNAPMAVAALASNRGWTSGEVQAAGMWFQIELPQPAMLAELQFDVPAGRGVAGPAIPYPRAYRVEVSMDGTNWGTPVAQGAGAPGRTVVTFAPTRGRFLRISQTEAAASAPAWAMTNVRVYAVESR